MDKEDIRNLPEAGISDAAALPVKAGGLRHHRRLCRRATCRFGVIQHFLSDADATQRGDEYGESLGEPYARLFRELVIEECKDAVGGTGAPYRSASSLDELIGPRGITSNSEVRNLIAMHGRSARPVGRQRERLGRMTP